VPLSEGEELQQYTVRLRPRAVRDLDAEAVRLAELEGDTIALDWLAKLKTALGTLTTWPRRFPLAPEEELLERSVRVMLFRRTPSGPAWRVFFTIEDAGNDGFVVRIRHIRHGASPLSTYDAGELLTDA
jgi:plasmid stabilization system protein ParE